MFCLHFEQSRRFKGRFKTHAMCCIIYKLLQGNAGEKSRDTSQGLLSLWKQSESVINVIRDSLGISGSLCGHIFSASPLEVLFFNLALFFTDSAFWFQQLNDLLYLPFSTNKSKTCLQYSFWNHFIVHCFKKCRYNCCQSNFVTCLFGSGTSESELTRGYEMKDIVFIF